MTIQIAISIIECQVKKIISSIKHNTCLYYRVLFTFVLRSVDSCCNLVATLLSQVSIPLNKRALIGRSRCPSLPVAGRKNAKAINDNASSWKDEDPYRVRRKWPPSILWNPFPLPSPPPLPYRHPCPVPLWPSTYPAKARCPRELPQTVPEHPGRSRQFRSWRWSAFKWRMHVTKERQ